jgi:hypothetical protein
MLLPNTALDSDHDILSLDPAMVNVKAASLIPGALRPLGGMTERCHGWAAMDKYAVAADLPGDVRAPAKSVNTS